MEGEPEMDLSNKPEITRRRIKGSFRGEPQVPESEPKAKRIVVSSKDAFAGNRKCLNLS
jgi:hypothetical protein